jgi:hypothetical protein
MYKPRSFVSILLFALTSWVPALSASQVDSLTLTPVGSNTLISIAGTFDADTPSIYSPPNTPYLLTFEVPTAPATSPSFTVNTFYEVFLLSFTATLNGVDIPNSSAAFYPGVDSTGVTGGGALVCIGFLCNSENNRVGLSYDIFGDSLFTGPYTTDPVFVSGNVFVDPEQTQIYGTESPEPATTALAGLGILLIASIKLKRPRNING